MKIKILKDCYIDDNRYSVNQVVSVPDIVAQEKIVSGEAEPAANWAGDIQASDFIPPVSSMDEPKADVKPGKGKPKADDPVLS